MDKNLHLKINQYKILTLVNIVSDLELIKIHLENFENEYILKIAESRDEYINLLEIFQPDVVISDFNVSESDGLHALKILRTKDEFIPFIYITDNLTKENAVEAFHQGATDIIMRKHMERLATALRRAIHEKKEKKEKKSKGTLAKLLEVNFSFISALFQDQDWKKTLQDTLPLIGEIVSIDRVFFCEKIFNEISDEKFAYRSFEWTSGSIRDSINHPETQKVAFNRFNDFAEPLSKNCAFQAIVSQLPEGALKENLSKEAVLSFIVVPVFIDKFLYGYIGLDDCTNPRKWTSDIVTFLEKLCSNLATAIERKKSVAGVTKSEQTINTAIRNIPGITYRCLADRNWTMQLVSDEIERITGYPAADFINNKKRTYASIIHPEDIDKTYLILDPSDALEAFNLEYRLVCADGSLRWVEERGHGIYDDDNVLQSIEGLIMDVTDTKKANGKFQAIFDQSTDAIFLADDKAQYVDFNKAAIKLFGYTRKELCSMNVAQLMGIPSDENFIKYWNRFLETGQEKGILSLPKKNGSTISISYNAVANILPGVHLSIISNITDKLQKEEQLLASERKFKALVQEGSDLLSILDLDANYLFVSESSTIAVLGFAPKDLVGRNDFEFIHPDDKERVFSQFSTLKDKKQINISPFRFRDKDQQWRMIATTATNLLNDPAVGGIVANSRDVTESIVQKEALKVSNERFELAMKATNEMIWDWDLSTDRVTRSSGFQNIFGFHNSSSNAHPNFWMGNIHEDDVEATKQSLITALKNTSQEKWEKEYRMVKADGKIAYIADRGYIIRDEVGRAVRIVGAVSNITDSREMLHEISEQNRVLKEIAWTQSHIVRAPLARLQGLVNLLETEDFEISIKRKLLGNISDSAAELDAIIRNIVKKAEQLER